MSIAQPLLPEQPNRDPDVRKLVSSGHSDALQSYMHAELARTGWLHIDAPLTHAEFEQCVSLLGTSESRTKVRLSTNPSAPLFQRPDPLGFHTDSGDSPYVAWFCERPANSGGQTLLMPASPIVASLSERDIQILTRTYLRPSVGGYGGDIPILRHHDGDIQLYFAGWRLRDDYSAEQLRALRALHRQLRVCAAQHVCLVHWRAGASLFIDNRRVLHARGRLDPGSERTLIRQWIR